MGPEVKDLGQYSSTLKSFNSLLGLGVNVKHYGAVGNFATDDTIALQSALDTGQNIIIPAGSYRITAPLRIKTYGQVISGAGMELTMIKLDGVINGFIKDPSIFYIRVSFRDFAIYGDTSATLDAINFDTACVYESKFENLKIRTGGRAIFMPNEFSTLFINVHASSDNNHGIEICGSVSTTLINCYVHIVPLNKVAYKVHGGACMISCNGVEQGGTWGEFGSIQEDDNQNWNYRMTFINCNVEDFSEYGIVFKNDGIASFMQGAFVCKSTGTYKAEILVKSCTNLITFNGVKINPQGATRISQAPIESLGKQSMISFGGMGMTHAYDSVNNSLYKISGADGTITDSTGKICTIKAGIITEIV